MWTNTRVTSHGMTCNVWRDGVQVVSIQLLMAAALGLLADLVAINEHATRL